MFRASSQPISSIERIFSRMPQTACFIPRLFEFIAETSKMTSENSLPSLSDLDLSCRSNALKIAGECSAAFPSVSPYQVSLVNNANLVFSILLAFLLRAS